MSRPGAWAKVWSNFMKYIRKDWATKSSVNVTKHMLKYMKFGSFQKADLQLVYDPPHYIGEDHVGHRYYELANTRQSVTRGFDPPPNKPDSQPGVEWQSWLKGTRRFPPSDQELALNQMRGKAQLAQNTLTEKRAPRIDTKDPPPDKDKPAPFPKYDDMESAPGVKKGD